MQHQRCRQCGECGDQALTFRAVRLEDTSARLVLPGRFIPDRWLGWGLDGASRTGSRRVAPGVFSTASASILRKSALVCFCVCVVLSIMVNLITKGDPT